MSGEQPKVWPVILSGGSGTRLWPKSRILFPKQFHSLTSEHTLLQEALLRVVDPVLYAKPMVVCNEEHRFIVAEQAEELGVDLHSIVLEHEGRNTAPAVAVAAHIIRKVDPNGLILVLASDHHIGDPVAFSKAVALGVPAAVDGYICTFGITPNAPETGYGYIKRTPKEVYPSVYRIDQFKEKPNLETAKKYVADPTYAWNAGLFLFSAQRMMEELDQFEPSIGPACVEAVDKGLKDDINKAFQRLDKAAFSKAKSMSLDYAIMERTKKSAVIPMDAAWTDVGSWSSLYATCVNKPTNNPANVAVQNYLTGEVSTDDVESCYLCSDGPLLAAIGIRDLFVVATDDAVLVAPMNRAQDVGKMAKKLKAQKKHSLLAIKHKTEYKPWGSMRTLATGPRYRVIELTIKPGAGTSLQLHYHRAMHQVVVKGTAMVVHGEETVMLHENQSTFVPIGMRHRLENPGKVPLVVMEVQSGSYLGDDDIVRIEGAHSSSKMVAQPSRAQTQSFRPSISGEFARPYVHVPKAAAPAANPAPAITASAPASTATNGSFILQTLGAMAVGAALAVNVMSYRNRQ